MFWVYFLMLLAKYEEDFYYRYVLKSYSKLKF